MENQIENFKKLPCELERPASAANGAEQEGLEGEHRVIAIQTRNYAES
jgi:hypothetical protein